MKKTDWNARAKWNSEVTTASVVDRRQLNVMHNFDYFYIFTLECNIRGQKTLFKAVGVIPVSQANLIKKGASAVVKYSIHPPQKTAVEYIIDSSGQHHVDFP